jgi:hypothetical protein
VACWLSKTNNNERGASEQKAETHDVAGGRRCDPLLAFDELKIVQLLRVVCAVFYLIRRVYDAFPKDSLHTQIHRQHQLSNIIIRRLLPVNAWRGS